MLYLLYGVVCYSIFFGTFLYAIGFVTNLFVPKSIDSAATIPVGEAILINAALLGLFAVQHSVMARKGFKKAWTKIIPEPLERSTYVLFASTALILMFWLWEPIGGTIWNVEDPVLSFILQGLGIFGWLQVLTTTFLINHFDLFGLKQVWYYFTNKEYKLSGFVTPGPYKLVRHPLYLGFLIAFWATPTMTITHLVFAIATTAYILVAIQLEEKDLVKMHGKNYTEYRKTVPMIVPFSKKSKSYEGALVE
jgi:protein-S-isoprenylcysteine O-methyltransferase Ste14